MDDVKNTKSASASRKKWSFPWIVVAIFWFGTVLGFGLWAISQKRTDDALKAQHTLQKKYDDAQASLKTDESKLRSSALLPDLGSVPPLCGGTSNNHSRLAPVTSTPVDGYSVYVLSCQDDIAKGITNTGKVLAFKTTFGGSQTLAYTASNSEPFCISAKSLSAQAATDISNATGLPVCKTS